MNILVVALQYLPDGGPAAPLYGMLCERLAARGHHVTVVSAVPHYPSGIVAPEFRKGFLQRTVENGVNVIRVRIPSLARANLAARLLQFLIFQFGASLAVLSARCDVVLAGNPAIEVFLPFAVLTLLRRRPAVFSVHDVYPDVGVALGIFRNPMVIALVRALEAFCVRRARAVRILSESFLPGVLRLGAPASNIRLVYDWVDTRLITPLPRDNGFAREHNITDGFVVLYAGNIGLSQGLEEILRAAECLAPEKEITFLFVGGGAGLQDLLEEAAAKKLENVRFLPFQPRSRLPEVLATADLGLVVLKPGIAGGSLPSKLFSILASGRPVLAAVDPGSDAALLLQRSGAGLCVRPGDTTSLTHAIGALKDDRDACARFGANGRAFALKNHSPESAASAFEDLLIAVQQRKRS